MEKMSLPRKGKPGRLANNTIRNYRDQSREYAYMCVFKCMSDPILIEML